MESRARREGRDANVGCQHVEGLAGPQAERPLVQDTKALAEELPQVQQVPRKGLPPPPFPLRGEYLTEDLVAQDLVAEDAKVAQAHPVGEDPVALKEHEVRLEAADGVAKNDDEAEALHLGQPQGLEPLAPEDGKVEAEASLAAPHPAPLQVQLFNGLSARQQEALSIAHEAEVFIALEHGIPVVADVGVGAVSREHDARVAPQIAKEGGGPAAICACQHEVFLLCFRLLALLRTLPSLIVPFPVCLYCCFNDDQCSCQRAT